MLEKYKVKYKELYQILNTAISNDRINHAYMFEVNSVENNDELIKDICKAIIFKNGPIDENINTLIDENNYQNIKVIKADGMWIKKEQILEVQSDFKKESFDNLMKIYIIEDASKLNKSSANTLLKFLEEPEKGIVALLFTVNKYEIIKTILSRCICIGLKNKEYQKLCKDDIAYQTVETIEKYQQKSLPFLYLLLNNDSFDRQKLISVFQDVQKIYSDLLYKIKKFDEKYLYFDSDGLNDLLFQKDEKLIIRKIEIIQKNSEYLKNNISIKSFLDKIVIEMYGGV